MSENKNFMEMYFENQKKMFNYWLGLVTNVANPRDSEENKKDTQKSIYEESLKYTHEIIKQWVELNNQYTNSISKFVFPGDTLSKIFTSANFYQDLSKFWEDLVKNVTGKESDPFKFYTKWNGEYLRLVSNNFGLYFPEQFQSFYTKFIEIYTLSTNTSQKFYNPWLEGFQSLQNLLVKSVTGDKSAYIEFMKLWNEKFNSTFGKIFNLPQFSMNRTLMQKEMHSLNAFINFIITFSEFLAMMAKVSQETLEKIIKDYQQMLIEGTNPKSFQEFYEYWWTQNEAAYHTLFGTDEFCKLIAQVMDTGVNFKKDYDSLLENLLKFLPYPSRTDMDSVYKTLDDLKRDVRTLKREIAQLRDDKSNN